MKTEPPIPVDGSVSAETPSASVGQRRADAFEHIVRRFLAGGGSRSTAGAHEVVVHIAHDALCDEAESSGAEFDDGRPVAVETARRLGCDGALVGVVEGAKGEPLAVGRRTRAVPPAIRRALRVRDGGCRFPGCDRSRYVHAHHIKHWADGGASEWTTTSRSMGCAGRRGTSEQRLPVNTTEIPHSANAFYCVRLEFQGIRRYD